VFVGQLWGMSGRNSTLRGGQFHPVSGFFFLYSRRKGRIERAGARL